MIVRSILVAAALVSVMLAGCADSTDPDPEGIPPDYEIEAGKGAISGILVDDRFRPIHLTESPQTEFQTTGLVLLQETGQQVKTNANGEFAFVDLEPGVYTLRVTADGYEAKPQAIKVNEGIFNEASIQARRILNDDGLVISEEFAAFIPCQESVLIQTSNYCSFAFYDASGDSSRDSFTTDYRAYNLTSLVVEFLTNKDASRDGALKLVMRNQTDDSCYVANHAITDGNYLRVWLRHGEVATDFDIENRNCAWTNTQAQSVEVWAQGQFKEEGQPIVNGVCTVPICVPNPESRGIGVQPGVAVQILVTGFVGDPEEGVENYCRLC